MNKDVYLKLNEIINDFESCIRETQEKIKLSRQALDIWKRDELEKLNKRRQEIELKYDGNIIDLKAEEEFVNKISKINKENDEQIRKMQGSMNEIIAQFNSICENS